MLKAQPRVESSKLMAWFSPVLAICLTAIVSSIMFTILDISPIRAFEVFILMPMSDAYNFGELLVKATPLLLCATGLALCYRANIWNIGAEGQLLIGAVFASAVAVNADMDSGLGMLTLTIAAGCIGGMSWAAIPTLLNRVFHTNIILTTIMLNYIGLYVLLWAVHGPLADPQGFGFPESVIFEDGVLLPLIMDQGRATISTLFALAFAIITGVVLYKTLPGFQLRVFGDDASAARYAGFNSNKIIWLVMCFAGALAGFAGAAEVAGPIGQLIPSVSPGYGYAAIIVAYLGRLNPFGIILASLFMGTLYMGSDLAQIELGLPTAITGLFQGSLLFFLLACDFLIYYRITLVSRNTKKRNAERLIQADKESTSSTSEPMSQSQGAQ